MGSVIILDMTMNKEFVVKWHHGCRDAPRIYILKNESSKILM